MIPWTLNTFNAGFGQFSASASGSFSYLFESTCGVMYYQTVALFPSAPLVIAGGIRA